MNAHVTDWLGPYHDGELAGKLKQQVEEHLNVCRECQTRLEDLRKLSALLQEVPLAVPNLSAQRFQAQVKLRLWGNPSQTGWQRALKAGWQLAPLSAVAVWAFFQAALAVTAAALLLGLPGGLSLGGLLSGLPTGQNWLILPGSGLGWSVTGIGLGLLNLGLTALLAIFLGGWLASWWITRRQTDTQYDLMRA